MKNDNPRKNWDNFFINLPLMLYLSHDYSRY